jgi:sugar/nucleoside kinase (ribokinase family)
MTHLLVIGSPSLDKIHIAGKTHHAMGGAGMYMSMAAKRSGVEVTMFGPKPDPIPQELNPLNERLLRWIGPAIDPDLVPRFEISHDGDSADYLVANLESEQQIDTSAFPQDLSPYDGVHITAMGDAQVQKAFLDLCLERGARFISIGTWRHNVVEQAETTRYLLRHADAAFMNEEEATVLFGSVAAAQVEAGRILYITLSERGVLVIQGGNRTMVAASKVRVKDPTGAGESFCGAVVANLLQGEHPLKAAMRAVVLAGEKIEGVGPEALLREDPPPAIPLDTRVALNEAQIHKVAAIVKDLSDADPFGFVSDYLPPEGHPAALDFLFAVTFQQFSFWTDKDGRYDQPLIAEIDGVKRKGSAYMYAAYTRLIDNDPEFFLPQRQAKATVAEMRKVFRADDGSDPMPALELHVEMANAYGRDMLALGLSPAALVAKAMAAQKPLQTFVKLLDHIGGYKEDPIRKKSNLLALSVSQRPEAFLRFGSDETVAPVVDYHCMRAILRQGLVDVLDADLKTKLAQRMLLTDDEEWAVRFAGYRVQEKVEILSGRPIGAVDWFFFNYTRSHCPEMTDPVCAECKVDKVCAKRKEMFQPVLRTTYY